MNDVRGGGPIRLVVVVLGIRAVVVVVVLAVVVPVVEVAGSCPAGGLLVINNSLWSSTGYCLILNMIWGHESYLLTRCQDAIGDVKQGLHNVKQDACVDLEICSFKDRKESVLCSQHHTLHRGT